MMFNESSDNTKFQTLNLNPFTTSSDIIPARSAPGLPDRSAAAASVKGSAEGDDTVEKLYDENQKQKEVPAVGESGLRRSRLGGPLKRFVEKNQAAILDYEKRYAASKRNYETMSPSEWNRPSEISLTNTNKKNRCFDQEESYKLDVKSIMAGLDVHPDSYLADFDRVKITSDGKIMHTIKEDRWTLQKFLYVNPLHPGAWIAAAKFEEKAGKINAARWFIKRGCMACPNESLWVEACRLAHPDYVKGVVAKALRLFPNSVELWLQATKLERNDVHKTRVLKKALGNIPNSVRLWKDIVELADEEEDEKLLLLRRAVERCPLHVEFWLELARLENYDNAKKVLDRAMEKLSKEPLVWIAAAKLEEANGDIDMVGEIMERGIKELQRQGLEIDREAWMKEAEVAESDGFIATTMAIVSNV